MKQLTNKKQCFRCKSKSHLASFTNCLARNIKCFKCSRIGHFSKCCNPDLQKKKSIDTGNEVSLLPTSFYNSQPIINSHCKLISFSGHTISQRGVWTAKYRSEWVSPIIAVYKKNGDICLCINLLLILYNIFRMTKNKYIFNDRGLLNSNLTKLMSICKMPNLQNYPTLTTFARIALLPFPFSYLAECGFSAVLDLLTKK
ncbi:hypothetical protein A3Q56_06826 [Intoshia linei]|uniref:CCHC-type domain-containing protein n=1 Tax=Intoshia linei TaxID=1819745 RepID=A0A177ATW3_9BILA|nr:hypothetical protein A3Q56_06826 [Intoshia linei]